jgi:hypothetical protein
MLLKNSGRAGENAKCIGSTAGQNLPLRSINCLLYPNIWDLSEIPTSKMSSPLSVGWQEKEAGVCGNITVNVVGESATTKLAKLRSGRFSVLLGCLLWM